MEALKELALRDLLVDALAECRVRELPVQAETSEDGIATMGLGDELPTAVGLAPEDPCRRIGLPELVLRA